MQEVSHGESGNSNAAPKAVKVSEKKPDVMGDTGSDETLDIIVGPKGAGKKKNKKSKAEKRKAKERLEAEQAGKRKVVFAISKNETRGKYYFIRFANCA